MANSEPDAVVLSELGTRVAGARIALGKTQTALAAEAGISTRTLVRMEAGRSAQMTNWVRVLRALHLVDDVVNALPIRGESPLAQLDAGRLGSPRRRASPTAQPTSVWTWNEDSESPPAGTTK